MNINVDPIFADKGVTIHLGAMHIDVAVCDAPQGLIDSLEAEAATRISEMVGEAASSDPIIAASRKAFKACGKDPSRYRPSSEALMRRILSGKGLYFVNNVVDAGNLVSLASGMPVGCYDTSALSGDITLRIGKVGETYAGIGRGDINLEGLPLLADDKGPFGTPFSDSERASVRDTTTSFLFVIFGFNVDVGVVESAAEATDLIFSQYCSPQ